LWKKEIPSERNFFFLFETYLSEGYGCPISDR
jgi:hypothetical protein